MTTDANVMPRTPGTVIGPTDACLLIQAVKFGLGDVNRVVQAAQKLLADPSATESVLKARLNMLSGLLVTSQVDRTDARTDLSKAGEAALEGFLKRSAAVLAEAATIFQVT